MADIAMDSLFGELAELMRQPSPAQADGGVGFLLASMNPDRAALLKLCAIPHEFDAEILQAMVPNLGDAECHDVCDEFAALSLVTGRGDAFALRDQARTHLFREWLQPENSAAFTAASNRLAEHFSHPPDAASPAERERFARCHMFHLLGARQREGFAEFERLFREMRAQFRRSECRALIALAHEYEEALASRETAWLAYHEAKLAADERDWEDAEKRLGALIADSAGESILRVKACCRLGLVRERQGAWKNQEDAWKQAGAAYNQALQLLQSLPESAPGGMEPLVLHDLGVVSAATGQDRAAEKLFRQSIDLSKSNYSALATAWNSLGLLNFRRTDWTQAIKCHEASLDALRRGGDEFGQAAVFTNLANAYGGAGNWKLNEEYLLRSLDIKTKAGDSRGRAVALRDLVTVRRQQKQTDKAIAELEEAIGLFVQLRDRRSAAGACRKLAEIQLDLKNNSAAKEAFVRARDLFAACGCADQAAAMQKQADALEPKSGKSWFRW